MEKLITDVEIWKPIQNSFCEEININGLYEVSSLGKIRSIRRGVILKPILNTRGYLKIGMSINGKQKMFSIHRIVAFYFIPNYLNKKEVNHINGNKLDNRVENLEWVTKEENINHALSSGLYDNAGPRKLSARLVKEIRDRRANGVRCKVLAKEYDVSIETIKKVIYKKCWKYVE